MKNAMKKLHTLLSLTQLRFHCRKETPGRTFHVVTAANNSGESMIRFFSGLTDEMPKACGSFVRMDDDDSLLARECARWGEEKGEFRVGRWGHSRFKGSLYDYVTFIRNRYHWVVSPAKDRWEWDDFLGNASIGDFWKIFVR